MQLVRPALDHLPSYIAALERGWSADSIRPEAGAEELARIRDDAQAFIASMEDREGKGPKVKLPDGTLVNRIPGYTRWMWDGEFAGSINFRWQPGTSELPARVLGHIGYAVVPWKQRLGYATSALRQLLDEARAEGLPYAIITCDETNIASQRVIEANGGVMIERFLKPPQFGSKPSFRYRVAFR
ncbi:GNAT family N-acetyltransferase [Caenimonas koreensis]|uniref:GNAT family N-acetyltransferase n=1 Tax=Caenimonas koreensis TaxID=367474 RepID=UPI003784EE25